MTVLILGGTAEGLALARNVHAAGLDVTTSLAGRTSSAVRPPGRLRVGGFGGADGLATYLREQEVKVLIDATHPFAAQISENARLAADRTGVPRIALHRPPWLRTERDDWRPVADIAEAAVTLPKGARVLLTLGRQHIGNFRHRDDVHFVIRSIERPDPSDLPSSVDLVGSRPSNDPKEETAFLRDARVEMIVSRNSGGPGAFAKIAAAQVLGLPVIMIDRPPAPTGLVVSSMAEAMRELRRLTDDQAQRR